MTRPRMDSSSSCTVRPVKQTRASNHLLRQEPPTTTRRRSSCRSRHGRIAWIMIMGIFLCSTVASYYLRWWQFDSNNYYNDSLWVHLDPIEMVLEGHNSSSNRTWIHSPPQQRLGDHSSQSLDASSAAVDAAASPVPPKHNVWTTSSDGPSSRHTPSSSSLSVSSSTLTTTTTTPGDEYVSVCVTESCLQQTAAPLARAFPDRSHDKKSWCHAAADPQSRDTNTTTPVIPTQEAGGQGGGLILIKVPKAASSTSAGLVLRIATQSACRTVHWYHRPGRHYQHQVRMEHHHHHNSSLPTPTGRPFFLVGSIREPGSRVYSSAWFFQLGPRRIPPTDANILQAVESTRSGGNTNGKGEYHVNAIHSKRSISWRLSLHTVVGSRY